MKKIIGAIAALLVSQGANASNIELTIELSGLEPMKGQHYEGWNILRGEALSTGRFSIAKNGSIYSVNSRGQKIDRIGSNGVAKFSVDSEQLKSKLFVLTIEPNNDKSAKPSKVHVMGGDYANNKADLSIAHGSSLNTNFNSASGSFILAAPTGGNFNQGLWFFNSRRGGSLNLSKLPEGWAYEGWIVNTRTGGKYSTGIFQDPKSRDSDGAGRLAGPLKLSFPNAPGQDIVKSSVVLDDGIHAAVVTVEPYPDYDSAPYAIKILKSDISMGAPGMTPLSLDNISSSAPSGQVHMH